MIVKQLTDQTGTSIQPNVPDKVGYADYSSSSTITVNTTYTANEDGQIRIEYLTNGDSTGVCLILDGTDTNGYQTNTSALFRYNFQTPIKKGSSYKIDNHHWSCTKTPTNQNYKFLKLHTALGGGD